MRRRLAIGEHILKSTGDRGKRIIQSIGDGAFGNALDPGPDSGHVLFQILGDEKLFQPANRIALLPAPDFFLGALRPCKAAFFAFDMSPPAIGTSLDASGPFAGSPPLNRLPTDPPYDGAVIPEHHRARTANSS